MRRKSKAEQLFSRIPDGHENPLRRPSDDYTDRALRRMVEDANNKGDCIINVGRGYYRPLPNDPVDVKELHEYLNKDLSRARKVLKKRLAMRMTFEKWKEKEFLLINFKDEKGVIG